MCISLPPACQACQALSLVASFYCFLPSSIITNCLLMYLIIVCCFGVSGMCEILDFLSGDVAVSHNQDDYGSDNNGGRQDTQANGQ